jgi:hypothetical protein
MSRALLAEIPDLPTEAFKHVGDKRIKPQGGSGGGGSTTSTVTQTNLPAYAKPYFEELLKRTGRNIFKTDSSGRVTGVKQFKPYTDPRVAGFSQLQSQAQQEVGGMRTPEEFNLASQGAGMGGMMGYGAAQQGLGAAFGPTQNYMSPYIQGALDPQIRELNRQAALNQRSDALGSMRSGSFGGARQALMATERERIANQGIQDVLGRGYQSAFDAAQRQQQFLGGLGMQGLQQGLAGSELMGKIGTSRQAADLERLKAQSMAGAEQQALRQKELDLAYQQAMEARDWEKAQLQFYSDILRGNAGALGARQVTYAPGPSTAQQLGGLGIAGLGALLRG